MKRAIILFFSDRGKQTAVRIADVISDKYAAELHAPRGDEHSLVGRLFREADALIFVGACGIAVRSIAPFITSKLSDPAVVVADELGMHVISLLSGHIGGANALARQIAHGTGGTAVITTATDINRRFAVDEWAARRGLHISSMESAKRFAAEILRRDMRLHADFPIDGALPGGIVPAGDGGCDLAISVRRAQGALLQLVPRILHLGVGCKRGTPGEKIRAAVSEALNNAEICPEAVCAAASIDVKMDEAGLIAYAQGTKLPLRFYAAGRLAAAEGDFSSSAFVKSTVGVDNVCERAALVSAGDGAQIILRKTCRDGVTVAVAQEKWSICFE